MAWTNAKGEAKELEVDKLIVSIGRVPNTNGLNGNAVGTSAAPSGLNKLNAWISQPSDNVASRFYAGDMLGNLWRFDANNLTAPTGATPEAARRRAAISN